MKNGHRMLLILCVFSLIFLIVLSGCVQKEIPPEKYCEKDEDCVPNKRCHPTEVVNQNYQLPPENETGCTQDCRTILDCGRAKPVCRFNQCVIK